MEKFSKTINAWCMYDWSNSVYNLVINASIFPIYYAAVTKDYDNFSFLGFQFSNSVLYSYAISFSYLLSAFFLPILSGIADYTGQKKFFLKLFTYLGASACIGMSLFTGKENIEWGIFCVVIASVGYSSALVFYDAFLPEIASKSLTDRVSARGYSFGYGGSALMLIASLGIITNFEILGFSDSGQATRIVFLLVGLWWMGFAQIPFKQLPKNKRSHISISKIVWNGYQELRKVFGKLKDLPNIRKYLFAFFFFNMGVQTIMLLATLFGTNELNLGGSELIPVILVIQFVAIIGAFIFAELSQKRGNIFSLATMIFIWIAICIYAYFVTTIYQFYIIAISVGLVMGGIQALSRATFSKLIPMSSKEHTSFFSFFDVTYHVSVVMGTFSYGLIEQITGSMRNSTLALAGYFIIGLFFLFFVKMPYEKNTITQTQTS